MKKYRVHIVTNTGYHMTKEVIVKDPSEIREKLVSVHHIPAGIMDKIFPVLIENKKTYSELKEEARNKAIEWQLDFDNHNYSYGELALFGKLRLELVLRFRVQVFPIADNQDVIAFPCPLLRISEPNTGTSAGN